MLLVLEYLMWPVLTAMVVKLVVVDRMVQVERVLHTIQITQNLL